MIGPFLEPPSDARANEIKEELEKVEPANPFFKPLKKEVEEVVQARVQDASSNTFQNVTIEESPVENVFENKRPNEKVGMERFGSKYQFMYSATW